VKRDKGSEIRDWKKNPYPDSCSFAPSTTNDGIETVEREEENFREGTDNGREEKTCFAFRLVIQMGDGVRRPVFGTLMIFHADRPKTE